MIPTTLLNNVPLPWIGRTLSLGTTFQNLFGMYYFHAFKVTTLFGKVIKSELLTFASTDQEIWYLEADAGGQAVHAPVDLDGKGWFSKAASQVVKLANAIGYPPHEIKVQRVLRHYECEYWYIQLLDPYSKYLFSTTCIEFPTDSDVEWVVLTKRFQEVRGIEVPDSLKQRLADAANSWIEAGGKVTPRIGWTVNVDRGNKLNALL